MALTYTPELEIGMKCPDFTLPSVNHKSYSLADFKSSQVLAFLFICNHCPYVKAIEQRIIDLAKSYDSKDVQLIGICSNDSADYPEDSPEALLKSWTEKNYAFPYLIDELQTVAKDFNAVCTPDIFVFNKKRELTYRGRFDDSWKNPDKVEKQELKMAIDCTLQNEELNFESYPSMGCSIKWK